MSETQVLQLEDSPESAFSESINSNVVTQVRETAVDLVKTIIYYSDEDAVNSLIEKQLVLYRQPIDTQCTLSLMASHLLQREALLYLIAKLYFYVKHTFDFQEHLDTIMSQHSCPLVSISQLYLIEVHLEQSYRVEPATRQALLYLVSSLVTNNTSNTCLRL